MILDEPYSFYEKAKEYFHYLSLSKNRHSVHSPFVFNLIEKVFRKQYTDREVEFQRRLLLKDNTKVYFEDHGTGSDRNETISNLAKKSLKKKKEAELIARISTYFDFPSALELGTSLGITSAYIARTNKNIHLTTIEGSKKILNRAEEVWRNLSITNIKAYNGTFASILPTLDTELSNKNLFFIDGNHSYAAVKKYSNLIIENIHPQSMIIVDDIYWSKGMKMAWIELVDNEKVSLSIDLFEFGILFFDERLKKEHFILRF